MVRTRTLPLVAISPVDSSAIMPGLFLLRTQDEWAMQWRMVNYNREPEPELPPVDWGAEVVLFFLLGCRPTTGYRVRIEEVEVLDGELVARVTERRPGDGPTGQALTVPAHAVAIPAADARDSLLLILRVVTDD
ncbi:protease complex subunit PrcB family protein [Actinoplanes xinjiangensis]|uniref:protease complex subunit PrcB family protein n=1 Tax=Actinoplanes xinjiangensis TaxID=512350 RepID=UPI00342D770D